MTTDCELERWLAYAEEHARLLVANREETDTRQLRRLHALNTRSDVMTRLWRNLLTRYDVGVLDAAYNERCASIIGREVVR